MKKFMCVAVSLLLGITVLAGCSSKKEEPAQTPAETPAEQPAQEPADGEKQTFTVGFDQDFPPYGYVGDDGEFTGFDLEMAAEVANRLGWEIVYRPIDWDAKDLELNSGAIDCIWNGFTRNGREDSYTWSESYMDNSQIFVVKTSSNINSYADLADKVVTAQADSAALNALNSEDFADLTATFKELITCSQYNAAFMDLEAGAVDAIAMDIGVAKYQIGDRTDEFQILEEVLVPEEYAIGFKLGNEALRDQVQATLEEMVADGTFAEISNKWFGYDVCIIGN